MKELFNYASQPRAYADSVGKCLIVLEEGETIKDVIEAYIEPKKNWWERHYSNIQELKEYSYNGKVYSGRLVLLDTKNVYTG